MRIKLLAKRYAQALFDLALELKVLDKVYADMKFVDEVLAENRPLRKMMDNPVLDGWKKVKVLNKIFDDRVEVLTVRFLLLITKKGREKFVPFICKSFDEIYREHNNILSVQLKTAGLIDAAIRDDIHDKLSKATGMKIDMEELTDEKIIGGFILNYEDYQFDASIAKQLKRLQTEFSKNLYIRKY